MLNMSASDSQSCLLNSRETSCILHRKTSDHDEITTVTLVGIEKPVKTKQTETEQTPLTLAERLQNRRYSRLQYDIPTLECSPEPNLTTWNTHLHCPEIPTLQLPRKRVVFSYGRLCQGSPFHIGLDYNALHDPHTRNYFRKPSVRNQLIKQSLITNDAQVICSFSDFNKWRGQINRTDYSEQSMRSLQNVVNTVTSNQIQLKRIKDLETESSSQERRVQRDRQLRANQIVRLNEDHILQRFLKNQNLKKERMEKWNQQNMLRKLSASILARNTMYRRNLNLLRLTKNDMKSRHSLRCRILQEEIHADVRRRKQFQEKVDQSGERFLQRVQLQIQHKEARSERNQFVYEVLKKEDRHAAAVRHIKTTALSKKSVQTSFTDNIQASGKEIKDPKPTRVKVCGNRSTESKAKREKRPTISTAFTLTSSIDEVLNWFTSKCGIQRQVKPSPDVNDVESIHESVQEHKSSRNKEMHALQTTINSNEDGELPQSAKVVLERTAELTENVITNIMNQREKTSSAQAGLADSCFYNESEKLLAIKSISTSSFLSDSSEFLSDNEVESRLHELTGTIERALESDGQFRNDFLKSMFQFCVGEKIHLQK